MEYLSPKDGGPLQSGIGDLPKGKSISLISTGILAFFAPTAALGLCVFSGLIAPPVAQAAPIPTVRVLVEREAREIRIQGFDLVISDAATSKKIAKANGRSQIPVRCSLGGVVEIRTQGHPQRVSGPVHVESLGGFLRVGGAQYRDDLYVYSFNGDCIVVNHVDLEKYVAGLLNSEMSANWGLETLKAQAVAARTYAIFQMREASSPAYAGLHAPFDLDSSVKDQVYEGAHRERYRPLQAVLKTRGQILTYEGKPIKAFYHSTCGGYTETPEKVWGKKLPYMHSVRCGYCTDSPRYKWVYNLTTSELQEKLATKNFVNGNLLSMRVVERNSLGRASKVEVRGTHGPKIVPAIQIRDLLGTLNIRSTNFTLATAAGIVTFVGHGSGHGVGMCQYGAKAMGDQGKTYTQILQRYYPEAQLANLY